MTPKLGVFRTGSSPPVCTENLIRIDCVTESPNVNGDDRALLPLPDPVRLAAALAPRSAA